MLITIDTRPRHDSLDTKAPPVDNAVKSRTTISSSGNGRQGVLCRFVELPPALEILFTVHWDHKHVGSTRAEGIGQTLRQGFSATDDLRIQVQNLR